MSGIFSALSMLVYLIYIFHSFRRENISWSIKNGTICYKCKSNIEGDYFDYMTGSVKLGTRSLCKCCERDSKLDIFVEDNIFVKAKDKILTTSLFPYYLTTNLISVVVNVTSIWYKSIGVIGSFFLLISAILFYIDFIQKSITKK